MKKTTGAATILAVAGAMLVPTVGIASVPPSEPSGTEPAGTDAMGTEPAGTDAMGTEPAGTDAMGTEPAGTDAMSTEAAGTEAAATEAPAAEGAAPVDLSGACPETIVIQTDWFPEGEYGATYGLLGPDYEVDADNKVVSGPLYSQGQPTGVNVEIRSGGPAIGVDLETEFYADDSITFAYGTTDGQILSWTNTPLMSVVAPLEINPQIIMWDPATYPDVQTLADLGTEEITINLFGGVTFGQIFVANGTWSEGQIDPSYDGGPSRFIAENGAIAQQGYASAEPFAYENIFTDWGRPVTYQLIHDAGFQVYQATLAIRPDDLETLRPCLELFVPVVQQSAVDYINDPTATNAAIVDIVARYDNFWEYPAELAEYSARTQAELGLTGNGDDDTLGNLDGERIEGVLTQMRDAGLEVPDDLTADQLFTNEFIDESIGVADGDEPAPATEAPEGTDTTEAPAGTDAAAASTAPAGSEVAGSEVAAASTAPAGSEAPATTGA
jgi:hypothetical protein